MVGEAPRKLPILFYRTRGGTELVRNWLRSLDDKDQNTIGLDLLRVQFRWPVGMPLCRAMGDGLWEMRTNLPSNRIARLLFCVTGGRILVLHGFIKKTQKTPDEELMHARRRKKEMESEGGPI
jgi:phage-related protein